MEWNECKPKAETANAEWIQQSANALVDCGFNLHGEHKINLNSIICGLMNSRLIDYYNSIYLVDCNKNIDVWWRKLSMNKR